MRSWLDEMSTHSAALRDQAAAHDQPDDRLVEEMHSALFAIETCHKEGSLNEGPYLSETLGQLDHVLKARHTEEVADLLDDLDERIRLAKAEVSRRKDDRACEQPPTGPSKPGKPMS